MDEPTKARKPRADKGVPRGPRVSRTTPVGDAPIFVRVVLKSGVEVEFGCATRFVENGFHVFTYPSERDRYRETRREFAISEVVEIEITAARPVLDLRQHHIEPEAPQIRSLQPVAQPTAVPKIHSVRSNLRSRGMGTDIVSRLETSTGSIALSESDLSGALGVGAAVNGVGESSV